MVWVMSLLPIGLLVLGIPVFLILITTSLVALVFFLDMTMTITHLKMFSSVGTLAFLAAPFFIFAGELMSRGGLSNRIVNWVLSLVGGVRGSLGITTVGSCAFFGAMSGSGAATTAAIGQVLYRPLIKNGYSESFSAGVVASAGGHRGYHPAVHRHDPLRRFGRGLGGQAVHRRLRAWSAADRLDGGLHLYLRQRQ